MSPAKKPPLKKNDESPRVASIFARSPDVSQPFVAHPQTPPQSSLQMQGIDNTALVLSTIREGNEALKNCFTQQFQQLEATFTLLKADVHKLADKMSEQEFSIHSLTKEVNQLKSNNSVITSDLKTCMDDLELMERRSRRNNLRLTGVRERIEEGKGMEQLVESIIASAFGWEDVHGPLSVEIAHRIPNKVPPPGAPPRTIIVKMLSNRHKEKLMQISRVKRNVRFDGDVLNIFPDYTRKVQAKRLGFWEAKQILREKRVPYTTIREATLRITYQGHVHLFEDPGQAKEYALTLKEVNEIIPEQQSRGEMPIVLPRTGVGQVQQSRGEAPTDPFQLGVGQVIDDGGESVLGPSVDQQGGGGLRGD